MIWTLGIALALALSFYLIAPFISRDVTIPESEEVMTYRAELQALQQSDAPDAAKIARLQNRLLKAAKTEAPQKSEPSKWLPAILTVGLLGGTVGIYASIGSPNFTPETRQPAPAAPQDPGQEFQTLLPRFEALLAENPEDAKGWNLYGRTLMLSGDAEAGLRAYERSLELEDTPEVRREYEAAKTFASSTGSGPSAEDIAAMQNLSPEDRTAAIEGMVESLRARLESDPSDVEGWTRLLRSRKVLRQTEQGEADIKTLRRVLPDQADAIIAQSGWVD